MVGEAWVKYLSDICRKRSQVTVTIFSGQGWDLTDQIVALDDLLYIVAVNTDCHTHEQVLGSLGDLAIDA